MKNTWRWFGPEDRVTLSDVRQAGASGVVTALHHVRAGIPWTIEEVRARQEEIRIGSDGELEWNVVESLPVSEAIKTKGKDYSAHIQAYQRSLECLAEAGISTICYNFMPVLDWTRTHLRWPLPNGATTMRFDLSMFAALDCFILARQGAEGDYSDAVLAKATSLYREMSEVEKAELLSAAAAGLPGAADNWTLDGLRDALAAYANINRDGLRQNHIDFLSEIVGTAEKLGLRMCCHPDDPPFPLLGLPRVMSSLEDYACVLDAVDSRSVGMTLCTGSLGASPQNDCVEIARRFASKIHFVHLRNVTRESESEPCSFFEDGHLGGQVDMVGVIKVILDEEARRHRESRADAEIPMRPDHGQEIISDLTAGYQPGYPAVGRLKGLAEIRGIVAGLKGSGGR